MRLALLALLMLAVGPKPARPSLELHVSPPFAFAPAVIDAWAKVTDPAGALACPEVVWTWGDGCSSKRAVPDCDPYALNPGELQEWTLIAPRHTYRLSGEYAVRLEVSDGKTALRASVLVRILATVGE